MPICLFPDSCLAQLEFKTDLTEGQNAEEMPLSRLVTSKPNEQKEDTLLNQLSYLIHQRHKIKAGLLDDSIAPDVKAKFQRLLEELEGDDHNVVDVKKGSISFLLFRKHEAQLSFLPDRIDNICSVLKQLCIAMGKLKIDMTPIGDDIKSSVNPLFFINSMERPQVMIQSVN